jgi:hypothetical protein
MLPRTSAAATFIAVMWLTPGAASAGSALDRVLHTACRTKPVCVIDYNSGGEVAAFQRAAEEVLAEGKQLVIDGRCESACVILMDIARANTCLTPRADLAVHQAANYKIIGRTYVRGRSAPVARIVSRQDPPHAADINAWVASHGGYPADGFMTIPLQQAQIFWPMCPDSAPMPAS